MKVSDMFPSKYLAGADMAGPVTVIIAEVRPEPMYKPGVGQTTGFVMYCEKASKGVVLSRPLAKQIAQALGADDTEAWKGKRITLYPEPLTVAGVARVAIRARAATPQAPQPAAKQPAQQS